MDSEEATGIYGCPPHAASPEMGRLRRTLALSERPREALGSHEQREVTQAFRAPWTFTGIAYSPRRRREAELGRNRG